MLLWKCTWKAQERGRRRHLCMLFCTELRWTPATPQRCGRIYPVDLTYFQVADNNNLLALYSFWIGWQQHRNTLPSPHSPIAYRWDSPKNSVVWSTCSWSKNSSRKASRAYPLAYCFISWIALKWLELCMVSVCSSVKYRLIVPVRTVHV